MRRELCDEAIRLARVLRDLMPDEPEVRRAAGADAAPRLAPRRARWRRRRARAARRPGPRALGPERDRRGAGAAGRRARRGRPAVLAAGARSPPSTPRAAAPTHRLAADRALYDGLAALGPSPVVELNRAVAVAMADGPEAGLELVDALAGDARARANTTCSTRREPTCCAGSDAAPRRPRPTGARSSWPPTRSSGDFLERRLERAGGRVTATRTRTSLVAVARGVAGADAPRRTTGPGPALERPHEGAPRAPLVRRTRMRTSRPPRIVCRDPRQRVGAPARRAARRRP